MKMQSSRVQDQVATALAASRGQLTYVRGTNSSLAFKRSVDARAAARIRYAIETRDHMTFDQQTIDSAGAFLVGELERLDQRLNKPLAAVTWSRDIDLRSDVSIADETSSFTNSTFAAAQGIAGSDIAWIAKDATSMTTIALDIGKTAQPLNLWGVQLAWSLPELASAAKLGRPIDQQKYEMMLLRYNMDVDKMVYTGDTVLGLTGMLNHASLANTGNAVTGTWGTATPAQILADVNSLLNSVWTTAATAVMPNKLLVSPTEYNILVSTLISTAGNISILEFLKRNNIATAAGENLEIQPLKWLIGTGNTIGGVAGRGPAATNSMLAYRQEEQRIRYPLVPLQRTPMEYRGIHQIVSYYGRLGVVELVYPETMGRRANLG